MDDIKERVKETIIEALMIDLPPEQLGDTDDLSEKLGIDSVGFLEILTALEEEFDISIQDVNVNRQSVGTVESLSCLIAQINSKEG